MANKTIQQKIKGMQCLGCEQIIEDAVHILPGIFSVKANYAKESATVEFDNDSIGEAGIQSIIEKNGFDVVIPKTEPKRSILNKLIFIVLLLAVGGDCFLG